MKLNKKALLLFLPLCLLSMSTIVYASIPIWGNMQTVNVQYSLVLATPTLSGSTVTLTATLTNNGIPVPNAQVQFFHCAVDKSVTGANLTALSTVVTNAQGIASWNQPEATNGIYRYIPFYLAP